MGRQETDWSWLGEPGWGGSFLVAGVVLALFMLPPFRHLWREVKVALAGGITLLLGMLVGVVHEPVRLPLLAMGTAMCLVAFWLFFGAPGRLGDIADSMGPDGAEPRDIDHSVAPHDISDPETAELDHPDALEIGPDDPN
jgi:hypothetical protein